MCDCVLYTASARPGADPQGCKPDAPKRHAALMPLRRSSPGSRPAVAMHLAAGGEGTAAARIRAVPAAGVVGCRSFCVRCQSRRISTPSARMLPLASLAANERVKVEWVTTGEAAGPRCKQ